MFLFFFSLLLSLRQTEAHISRSCTDTCGTRSCVNGRCSISVQLTISVRCSRLTSHIGIASRTSFVDIRALSFAILLIFGKRSTPLIILTLSSDLKAVWLQVFLHLEGPSLKRTVTWGSTNNGISGSYTICSFLFLSIVSASVGWGQIRSTTIILKRTWQNIAIPISNGPLKIRLSIIYIFVILVQAVIFGQAHLWILVLSGSRIELVRSGIQVFRRAWPIIVVIIHVLIL